MSGSTWLRARGTKDWFGRPTTFTPYLQILNVLNTKNALLAEAEPFGQPWLRYLPQLSILPALGVEGQF